MTVATLSMYDPYWEYDYDVQHNKLCAQWQAAKRERDPAKRRVIKDECWHTLGKMRMIRMRQYRTPAEAAFKVLEAIRYRAIKQGVHDVLLPAPSTFKSLPQLRSYLRNYQDVIDAHKRREVVLNEMKDRLGVDRVRSRSFNYMTINPSGMQP